MDLKTIELCTWIKANAEVWIKYKMQYDQNGYQFIFTSPKGKM